MVFVIFILPVYTIFQAADRTADLRDFQNLGGLPEVCKSAKF